MIIVLLLWVIILTPLVLIYLLGIEIEKNKKEKINKMFSEVKKNLIQEMKERNFGLVNVNADERKFIFLYIGDDIQRDKIICEVDSKHEYRFVFTCEEMCGILDSGNYDELQNSIYFENRLTAFTETVCVLKRYYGIYE